MKTSAVGPANDPLAMQLPVHHLRRRHIDPEPLGPSRAIGVVAFSPALRAGAMSGSEGDRFVVEIQERVVMRLPLLMPAPSELERAGDPQVACVEADDLVAGVKDAPVARPCTPERDRFDVTSWCYTITGRRHGVHVTLINRQGSRSTFSLRSAAADAGKAGIGGDCVRSLGGPRPDRRGGACRRSRPEPSALLSVVPRRDSRLRRRPQISAR